MKIPSIEERKWILNLNVTNGLPIDQQDHFPIESGISSNKDEHNKKENGIYRLTIHR